MIDICTLNAEQSQMLQAFLSLADACKEEQMADIKQWELLKDPDLFAAFQSEWQAAFENRTQKRKEAYIRMRENPDLAADLIERLIKHLLEQTEKEEKIKTLLEEADRSCEGAACGYDEGFYSGESYAYATVLEVLTSSERI